MVKKRKEEDTIPLWEAYREQGCQTARKKLIIHYSPLVKYLVGRIMIYFPSFYEADDLISYGTIGLIDAVEGFDPGQGVKFSTYAMVRIKGAIFDALRAQDWVPRSVREKAKQLTRALDELEQKLKQSPSDQELADYLNITKEELDRLLAQVAVPQVLSLNSLLHGEEREERVPNDVPGPPADNPLHIVQKKNIKEILAGTIDRLNPQERMVITLYYYEGLTLKEIGDVMGLSTARISQLHTRSILRLRGMLSREKQNLLNP